MATQVVMPKLSPTMEEGQLSRWLKKEGDKVSVGEGLAEIDTDKATMEAQALAEGVLLKVFVGEGETVPLGTIIAVIGEPGEDISGLVSEASSGSAQPERKESVEDSTEKEPIKGDVGGGPSTKQPDAQAAAAEDKGSQRRQQPSTAQPAGNGRQAQGGRLLVSPIAARMAAEAGINLHELSGSGPNGRIVKRDIEAAMSAAPAQAAPQGGPEAAQNQKIQEQTGAQARQQPAQPQFVAPQIEGAA